jgi:hypothetical protein
VFPAALWLLDGELQADLHQQPAEGSAPPAKQASDAGNGQPARPNHEPRSRRATAHVGLALTSK